MKITDFGISKNLNSNEDVTSTSVGTPCYMAPEIFKGIPYNNKTDVWALGCLFFEILAGKKAFEGRFINVNLRGNRSFSYF